MKDEKMDCDVAIVGYGPTGMVLASLLGQLGRKVIVLERYSGLYNLPRAAAFDDETMRTFQKLGVAERILPGTNIQTGYVWVNGNEEVLLDIEYDNPGRSGWPAQYMMYQPHLEDVLDSLAKSTAGVEVLQGMSVHSIAEFEKGVTVRARSKDGKGREIQASYVVGCDGGNGFVREHLGGGLDDLDFFENWLVCDFKLRHDVETLPSFRQVCNPSGPIAIVNIGPGYHRFSFRLEKDEKPDELVRPEKVWPRVARYLTEDDAELIRIANYVFESCIVDVWRKGRIVLAGDAAHQMPPFLAQGMVSGIRDARNLAWKLDMVLNGASESLLDTYQEERDPHVRFITAKAVELGRVQTMRDAEKAKERDARMIAARKANKKPDKLIYPPLQGGLIANDGQLLPQGVVSTPQKTALFDDIAGTGWLLVAKNRAPLSKLEKADRDAFIRIGGREIVFAISDMFARGKYSDTHGVYARWFDETNAVAAIVRPDSYVYGIAKSAGELSALLKRLIGELKLPNE